MQLHSGWEVLPSLPGGWKVKEVKRGFYRRKGRIGNRKIRKHYQSPEGKIYPSSAKMLSYLNELDTEYVWTQEDNAFAKRRRSSQTPPSQASLSYF